MQSGPLAQAVFGAAVAVGLTAVALGCGRLLRRRVGIAVGSALAVPVDAAVGFWLLGTASVLAGLVGAFSRPVLLTVALLAAVAAFRGLRRRGGWRSWEGVAAAAAGGLPYLAVAAAAPFFYDALVYHLGLPWQALQAGSLGAYPNDLFSTFPPLAQGVYAFPLAAGAARAAGLLHWIGFILAGSATAGLAGTLGAPRWARLAAAAAVPLLPATVLVPGLPAAEAWLLLPLLTALALAAGRPRPGSAVLAGFLAGAAAAARLQGVPWAALVLVVLVVRRGRRRAAAAGMEAVAAAVVAAAPWWAKNWVLLGLPLAPLGLGGAAIASLKAHAGTPPSPLAGLLALPGSLAPHAAYLVPLVLAAVLAAGGRGSRRVWPLLGVAAVGLLVWAETGTLARFLAPTGAVLVALAASAARRSPAGRLAAGLALGGAIALGATVGVRQVAALGGPRLAAAGMETVWRELTPNSPLAAFEEGRSLPTDARLLFVGEPRGYLAPRPFLAPSQHDPSPLLPLVEGDYTSGEIAATVRSWGFTHLLVNRGELARLGPGYPVAPWRTDAGRRRWWALLDELSPPVLDTGGVAVYDLATGAAGSGPEPVSGV